MTTIAIPLPLVVTLEHVVCGECQINFAMPSDMLRKRRADGVKFWCPNGHGVSYYETEAMRLAKELDATKRFLANARERSDELLERANRETRRVTAYKGVVKRTKNRIAKGICPCCSARFKNLEQHMKVEHPKWNPEAGAEVLAGKSA